MKIFSKGPDGRRFVGDTTAPVTEHEGAQAQLRAIRQSAEARVELTRRRIASPVGAFGRLDGRHRGWL